MYTDKQLQWASQPCQPCHPSPGLASECATQLTATAQADSQSTALSRCLMAGFLLLHNAGSLADALSEEQILMGTSAQPESCAILSWC